MYIDHSVYPDVENLPDLLHSAGERSEYVHRICAAWDFGIVPELETFRLFRGWRDIFDHYRLPHSPAYHAFRAWFGWPEANKGVVIETYAERLDRREQREDPCQTML